MAKIELTTEVGEDFERILDHLFEYDASEIEVRIRQIIRALDILQDNPLIGRKVRGELRELVIGKGARGYLALHRYVAEIDTVFILAIRSQKEVGYRAEL